MKNRLQLMWAQVILNRREVGAIVLVVTLGAAALFAVHVRFSPAGSGASFGPGWECTQVPNGEPICVKKVLRASPRSQ